MKVAAQPPDADYAHAWHLTATEHGIEQWRCEVALAARKLGADDDAVQLARLGVSELLSNVCKHVQAPECQLVVTREEDDLCVRLFDQSHTAPRVTVPTWHSEDGRGLWLLREMSASMGYTFTPTGKWVWFHCAVTHWGQQ